MHVCMILRSMVDDKYKLVRVSGYGVSHIRRLGDVEIAGSGYTLTPAKTRPFAFACKRSASVAGNRARGRPRVSREYSDGVDNWDGGVTYVLGSR